MNTHSSMETHSSGSSDFEDFESSLSSSSDSDDDSSSSGSYSSSSSFSDFDGDSSLSLSEGQDIMEFDSVLRLGEHQLPHNGSPTTTLGCLRTNSPIAGAMRQGTLCEASPLFLVNGLQETVLLRILSYSDDAYFPGDSGDHDEDDCIGTGLRSPASPLVFCGHRQGYIIRDALQNNKTVYFTLVTDKRLFSGGYVGFVPELSTSAPPASIRSAGRVRGCSCAIPEKVSYCLFVDNEGIHYVNLLGFDGDKHSICTWPESFEKSMFYGGTTVDFLSHHYKTTYVEGVDIKRSHQDNQLQPFLIRTVDQYFGQDMYGCYKKGEGSKLGRIIRREQKRFASRTWLGQIAKAEPKHLRQLYQEAERFGLSTKSKGNLNLNMGNRRNPKILYLPSIQAKPNETIWMRNQAKSINWYD